MHNNALELLTTNFSILILLMVNSVLRYKSSFVEHLSIVVDEILMGVPVGLVSVISYNTNQVNTDTGIVA